MRILSILIVVLSLTACQQSTDNKTPQTESKTDTSNKTNEQAHSNKSEKFSLLVELPYEIIESDEVCTTPVVMEFFAYQCPHCYKLEKFAAEWKKENNKQVQFRAIPTDLGHQEFSSFIIVHQAAKKLGILDSATPALFNRIHKEKQAIASLDQATEFLVSLGVSKQLARETLEDQDSVKQAIEENLQLLAKYKVTGVPTILVNHRYKFDVTKAGGYDKVFEVVNETLKLPSNCSKK